MVLGRDLLVFYIEDSILFNIQRSCDKLQFILILKESANLNDNNNSEDSENIDEIQDLISKIKKRKERKK